MRIAFAGTPEFAVQALDALHSAGHEIAGVFTQPDRPAGRGQKLSASPVALRAQSLGLPVFKPLKMDAAAQGQLQALGCELLVVVAYGQILPQAALDIPPRGCLNIHASLLPRWRGAAPIQRALLAGDGETGVTIMRMEAGLDTGPMLLHEAIPIGPEMDAAQLHDALAALGARLIVQALRGLQSGQLTERPQPPDGITYAHKLSKEEARLDWSLDAASLARRVRAYHPVPVAWTQIRGERVRIWRALAVSRSSGSAPGSITAVDGDGVDVACGAGTLRLLLAQWPGGRPLPAAQALQGRVQCGDVFS